MEIPLYNFHPASVKKENSQGHFTFSRIGMCGDLKVSVEGRKVFKVAVKGEKSITFFLCLVL
jgi:hypothetical protein